MYILIDQEIGDRFFNKFENISFEEIGTLSVEHSDIIRLNYFFDFKIPNKSKFRIIDVSHKDCNFEKMILENDYIDDCDPEVLDLMLKYPIYGTPSLKKNKIFVSLLKLERNYNGDRLFSVQGRNGWDSLEAFFQSLNKSGIKYLVLRKFEYLPFYFTENDKDIDVLCNDFFEFVYFCAAKKRSIGISGYALKIKDEYIPLDIRFCGDNYFDIKWQLNMIETRERNINGIYIMNDVNYIFSIIYHVLFQKKEISSYYKFEIKRLEREMFKINVEENLTPLLLSQIRVFFKSQGYFYVEPLDYSVVKNTQNILSLADICMYPSNKKLRLIKIYSWLRYWPKSIYNYINSLR